MTAPDVTPLDDTRDGPTALERQAHRLNDLYAALIQAEDAGHVARARVLRDEIRTLKAKWPGVEDKLAEMTGG
jgi:protein-arginine kinase activator protein McsA